MSLIQLDKVCKTYRTGNLEVPAVIDFTATIEAGEFTVLAGPSGSGKTTLLNLIGCLDQPSSGQVVLDGRNVATTPTRKLADFRLQHIGFIFQSYNLIPVLTALENAEFTLMLRGVPQQQRHQRVRELFALLGLEGLEDRRPNDLSGGQQQRVAIARAIAAEPAVVLADEPTANLDSRAGRDLLELMYRLNREQQTTFVFSSHDPQVVDMARRVISLHDGRLADDQRRKP
ncbi:ABC transporter ATP-binding protein [Geothermobacter hydrogeniphilus]|uniref:Macrolide ABC transporter ATP-binding protein n=1 Tax=Geothermobacter hydrogeniphilus TaxID=1969733 RepID=A0A1X0YD76_9BACT|nr:ABC transporter ATP-binding protein [Geothermobacter hydrogeniphilus]ORJ63128.1 macrolide ABC transporter ATP-binding protein [Geothermobacter hydrogeniphilus]